MANGTGSISAEVINIKNNQPVVDADVKLGGPATEDTKTDSNGNFKFSNLAAANNYTLDVSANGYRSEHYEDIVVLDDVDTNLGKLALWPEG